MCTSKELHDSLLSGGILCLRRTRSKVKWGPHDNRLPHPRVFRLAGLLEGAKISTMLDSMRV